jgi:hypothetical protein
MKDFRRLRFGKLSERLQKSNFVHDGFLVGAADERWKVAEGRICSPVTIFFWQ